MSWRRRATATSGIPQGATLGPIGFMTIRNVLFLNLGSSKIQITLTKNDFFPGTVTKTAPSTTETGTGTSTGRHRNGTATVATAGTAITISTIVATADPADGEVEDRRGRRRRRCKTTITLRKCISYSPHHQRTGIS